MRLLECYVTDAPHLAPCIALEKNLESPAALFLLDLSQVLPFALQSKERKQKWKAKLLRSLWKIMKT